MIVNQSGFRMFQPWHPETLPPPKGQEMVRKLLWTSNVLFEILPCWGFLCIKISLKSKPGCLCQKEWFSLSFQNPGLPNKGEIQWVASCMWEHKYSADWHATHCPLERTRRNSYFDQEQWHQFEGREVFFSWEGWVLIRPRHLSSWTLASNTETTGWMQSCRSVRFWFSNKFLSPFQTNCFSPSDPCEVRCARTMWTREEQDRKVLNNRQILHDFLLWRTSGSNFVCAKYKCNVPGGDQFSQREWSHVRC